MTRQQTDRNHEELAGPAGLEERTDTAQARGRENADLSGSFTTNFRGRSTYCSPVFPPFCLSTSSEFPPANRWAAFQSVRPPPVASLPLYLSWKPPPRFPSRLPPVLIGCHPTSVPTFAQFTVVHSSLQACPELVEHSPLSRQIYILYIGTARNWNASGTFQCTFNTIQPCSCTTTSLTWCS